MSYIIIKNKMSPLEKLNAMSEDARFDVADSEAPENFDGDFFIPNELENETNLPRGNSACASSNAVSSAMHIRAKPSPPAVPKIFLSNDCSFNCAYCGCRCTHDKERYSFEPREMAKLAVEAAVKSGQGIFLTSSVYKNADYTQELIAETVKIIRREEHYLGYLHAKVMPGADSSLIQKTGQFANRLSVNIEVAKSEGYRQIARQKNKLNILTPMRRISESIAAAKAERRPFASTQTTQLMAGATGESDRQILNLSGALYKTYRLKRVYYTPFTYRHQAEGYDLPPVQTPRWRMRRLYQADRLMELYGFTAEEITPPEYELLERDIDPKAAYALRHLDMFPVELNTASYEELLRIPGIGTTFARRIIQARKICGLTFEMLKKMRIPTEKSRHFFTCGGIYTGGLIDDAKAMREVLKD